MTMKHPLGSGCPLSCAGHIAGRGMLFVWQKISSALNAGASSVDGAVVSSPNSRFGSAMAANNSARVCGGDGSTTAATTTSATASGCGTEVASTEVAGTDALSPQSLALLRDVPGASAAAFSLCRFLGAAALGSASSSALSWELRAVSASTEWLAGSRSANVRSTHTGQLVNVNGSSPSGICTPRSSRQLSWKTQMHDAQTMTFVSQLL